ncbi:DUF6305 family protein [candidate division KSB1 bacterium]
MNSFTRYFAISLMIIFLVTLFTLPGYSQTKEIKAEGPVLLTSCGQSPGPASVSRFLKRGAEVDVVYRLQATVEEFKKAEDKGKPIKALFVVTGASLKGMGGAGVSIDDEMERVGNLITEAKKRGILVISGHVEGMKRRAQGAAEGDNSDEMSIDAVCPNSDLMVVWQDGNNDDRFTKISKDSKIPLLTYEKQTDLQTVLKDLFNK